MITHILIILINFVHDFMNGFSSEITNYRKWNSEGHR